MTTKNCYPDIPRRVSGNNLDDLLPEKNFNVARALVGSESTCVLVLKAKVRLVPSPPKRSLLVIGYPDAASAGDHVPEIVTQLNLSISFGPMGTSASAANLLIRRRFFNT